MLTFRRQAALLLGCLRSLHPQLSWSQAGMHVLPAALGAAGAYMAYSGNEWTCVEDSHKQASPANLTKSLCALPH